MKPTPPTLHNPLDSLIGYRLRRASAESMAELGGELSALGLKPSEGSILLLVAANPGITQSEIGRILGIQRANMTPLTAMLEKRGMLSRERVDGRSQGLQTTPDGGGLAKRVRAVMEANDARLLDGLSTAEKHALSESLTALLRGLPEG